MGNYGRAVIVGCLAGNLASAFVPVTYVVSDAGVSRVIDGIWVIRRSCCMHPCHAMACP